jgi:hypothetical protein
LAPLRRLEPLRHPELPRHPEHLDDRPELRLVAQT